MTERSEVSQALNELVRQPYGAARTAAAERLVDRAAQTGDRPLLIEALQEQISAHNMGGERPRMLVPFARTLKMWDDRPEDFDRRARHRLFWQFKWASTGMVWHPDVPLSTVRHWLDEMERRYRIAGHGLQPVYSQRHYLAAHLGAEEEAARYFEEWTAADRTEMSDCHACELHGQGEWHESTGDDAEALRSWAPVLRGERTCLEEPHLALAKSLLPLVRLGRADEARANHLRGYRMVRGNASMLRAVGQHLEFAALTGNEARGLEILAEHAGWFAPGAIDDAENRLGFYESAAVLLGRLRELGQDALELPVPPGGTTTVGGLLPVVERTVAETCRRFDERNGTSTVGDRSRRRLAAKPMLSSLPLGVRATTTVPAAPSPSTVDARREPGLDALVAEASRLTEARDPRAAKAWERVAGAGDEPTPQVRARIAESRAVEGARSDPGAAVELFLDVAERFEAAGEPAYAIVNRSRAALAAALSGRGWLESVDPLMAHSELLGLRADGYEVEERLIWTARFCAVRVQMAGWMASGADGAGRAALEHEFASMVADAERDGAGYELADALVNLAQVALIAGEVEAAPGPLDRAIETYVAVGALAAAAEALLLRARMAADADDPVAAQALLVRARQVGGELLDTPTRAEIAAMLADAHMRRGGEDGPAAAEALTAAHLFDDLDPASAIRARRQAAHAFERSGRPAEAAALLEALLPDLDDDAALLASVKHQYGRCLQALGEHRDAAKVYIATTALVRDWADQTAHASLTHDAGHALESAGLSADAEGAYRRAAELWQVAGDPEAAVRATRAAAWTLVQQDDADWGEALALFERAAAMSGRERPESLYQTAQLLLEWPADTCPDDYAERALALADEAATGLREVGDLDRAIRAELLAAGTVADRLHDRTAALARIARARERAVAAGATDLVDWCDDTAKRWERPD